LDLLKIIWINIILSGDSAVVAAAKGSLLLIILGLLFSTPVDFW
jgi:hypothetical protein